MGVDLKGLRRLQKTPVKAPEDPVEGSGRHLKKALEDPVEGSRRHLEPRWFEETNVQGLLENLGFRLCTLATAPLLGTF